MSIRRSWTEEQDRILKMLREQRDIKKWSSIAKIMDFQFHLPGRNGKQCRQRYKNHLDNQIIENTFSYQDQKLLEELHHKIGNRWSLIANNFKGRTANFLKNQMYSKLRKSIRRLNKFIKEQSNRKSMKQFKLTLAFKIVESNDFKIFQRKQHSLQDLDFYEKIKAKMLSYAEQKFDTTQQINQELSSFEIFSKKLIQELIVFDKKISNTKNKKKSQKKYLNEDEIIINSLSNNPKLRNSIFDHHQMQIQSQSLSQIQSAFQVLNKIDSTQAPHYKKEPELKMISSKNFDIEKQKECIEKQFEKNISKKMACVKEKEFYHVQQFMDENVKLIQEANINEQPYKDQRFLQQSQNHQLLDMQYVDSMKSYSYIDQSLFH